MKQFLEIGKIINTHGLKGEVKLELWCDDIDYLKQFKTLYLDENGAQALTLASARPQKNHAIVKLAEIGGIDDAERLKGKILFANRDDAVLEEGHNYIDDLIGCYVVDAETEQEYGRVCDVLNYGASDILDVESWGKHTLIPMIDDVIVEIDVEFQVITIKPMKGLFDEN